jgi:Na+/H+-dicarboxylate symporter
MNNKKLFNTNTYFAVATILGLLAGYLHSPTIFAVANVTSEIFINFLKLVSLPIIFLSIVSNASAMESVAEIKILGKKVIKYTLLTTVMAATIALILFVLVDPVRSQIISNAPDSAQMTDQPGYLKYLLKSIPSNFVQPFAENHVIGVLFIAIIFSLSILSLPKENRVVLHSLFSSLYASVMKITAWIVKLMPLAVWSFLTLFIKDMHEGLEIKSLALYLGCVVAANLIQGIIVLPAFLKIKKISPVQMFKGMLPALSLAFFTKSSSATLPMAMKCAEENIKISPKVSGFAFPLCTSINMNGCAAFILTTVLFVSMSNGIVYSPLEMVMWIFIATIAAVGNAGVPMGCYFLSSAFLAAMDVPLNILGVILPFYTLIDMLETSVNVWSDACVTAVVDKEVSENALASIPEVAQETLPQVSRCC